MCPRTRRRYQTWILASARSKRRDANVYDAREAAAVKEMAKLQGRGEPSTVHVRELSEKYGVPEKRLYWLHEM